MDSLGNDSAGRSELQRLHQKNSPSTAVAAPHDAREEGGAGVLLYYKFIELGEERRSAVKDWYLQHCGVAGLRGRVRVALDGVNCTLGGSLSALRRHIDSVKTNAILRGEDIDFKLSVSRGARNWQAALESGFTSLSVKAAKEVVSLGAQAAGLSHLEGGRHVSPQEFHRLLREEAARQRANRRGGSREGAASSPKKPTVNASAAAAAAAAAGSKRSESSTPPTAALVVQAGTPVQRPPAEQQTDHGMPPREEALLPSGSCGKARARVVEERGGGGGGGGDDAGEAECTGGCVGPPSTPSGEKEAVLLDVRNVYETSIGHFSAEGVERLDPKTRQFSELPKWVDENVDRLRGKRVLMYCTGGVRCEMASALIRRHCDAEATGTEVLQLSGGIERYLQAYPSHGEGATGGGGGGGGGAMALERGQQRAPRNGAAGDGVRSVQTAGGFSLREGTEEGSFFRGKNFVFDERVSVPETPAGGTSVGRCLVCERPWDDYGSRSRCTRCRVLVLVCDACVSLQAGGGSKGGRGEGGGEWGGRVEAAREQPPPAQNPLPDPRTAEGTVPARRSPRTTPPAPPPAAGAGAEETAAAGTVATATLPPPGGTRPGGKGVDGGGGVGGGLAATELVCPACRLRA